MWENRFSQAHSPPMYNGALAVTNEVCARRTPYIGLYSASPIYQTRIGVKRGCLMHCASPATSEKNFCVGYCILYWFGSYFLSDRNIIVLFTKRSTELLPITAQWLLNVPPGVKLKHCTLYLQSSLLCFVWIWEQTANISLHSSKLLVLVTETVCLLRGTSWVTK
jgi:hypothetical protein